MSQELIDSVNNLTGQTTALLNEYKAAKNTVDAKVAIAGSSASEAEAQVALAKAEKDGAEVFANEAETHKNTATSEANRASAEADRAQTEADRAQSEADRAAQVTGLDTVEDAISLEMQNHNPYGAMTKAERDALREQRKREGNGSGFKEWGKHYDSVSNAPINEGLWARDAGDRAASQLLHLGRRVSDGAGVSNTTDPHLNVDGTEIYIHNGYLGEGTTSGRDFESAVIKFPAASNGTKTLDGSEVRKYEDKAGVGELHEVYTPTFDGSTYVELPSYSMAVGATVEFKFKTSNAGLSQHIIDTRVSGNRNVFWLDGADGSLTIQGFTNITINGEPAADGYIVETDVEYHVTASISIANTLQTIGGRWDGSPSERFLGEIWDIKLEDSELPTGFRHYRNLVHQPAADAAPDTAIVPVVEKGSLEAGYQVNYQDDGYASIPDFPVADQMRVEMSYRIDKVTEDTRMGTPSTNGLDARFYIANLPVGTGGDNSHGIVIGSYTFWFPTVIAGEIQHVSVDIQKNADPAVDYTVSVTVNGNTKTNTEVIMESGTFANFGLGGYGDGTNSTNRLEGKFWDFKIEYPNAPDLNRYYKGIESEDPAGRLFVTDKEGFTNEDWGVNFQADTVDANTDAFIDVNWVASNELWEAECVVVFDSFASNSYFFNMVDGGLGANSAGVLYNGYSDTHSTVYINGIEEAHGAFTFQTGKEYHIKLVAKASMNALRRQIISIGRQSNFPQGGGGVNGTIRDVRITDLDNPANSRHYPLVTNSATQPADDTAIVDTLYDAATAPFYTPDWANGIVAKISAWHSSNDYTISGKFVGDWGPSTTSRTILKAGVVDFGTDFGIAFRTSPMILYVSTPTDSTTIQLGRNYVAGTETEFSVDVVGDQMTITLDGETVVRTITPGPFAAIDKIGARERDSGGFDAGFTGKIWDIRLIDKNIASNSRHYPSITYSPDAVPTGNVLEQTEFMYEDSGDLLADGWTNGNTTISGNVISFTATSATGASTSAIYANSLGTKVTIEYDITVANNVANNVTTQLRDGTNGGSQPVVVIGTGNGNFTGSWTFIPTDDGPWAEGVIYLRCSGQDLTTTVTVNSFRIKSADGTLINFPAGNEWILAQANGSTEGTPENFTGSVWNNDLPNTDAPMIGFAAPWEMVRFYDAELVGTTVWQPSTMQASQKAFDYASISDAEVIISRKDLSFIEVWDEKVSDKGILCPYGSVQSSLAGTPLTSAGVGQGYSAYGEWDEDTVGNVQVVASMTEDELKAFHADPKNNTWWDPEDGEYYQTRYRIRTVEGVGDGWEYYSRKQMTTSSVYAGALRYSASSNTYVHPQGSNETPPSDFSGGWPIFSYEPAVKSESDQGVAWAMSNATEQRENGALIPLTLTQRLNQGAYHPVYNHMGSTLFLTDTGDGLTSGSQKWHNPLVVNPINTSDCFQYESSLGVPFNGRSKVSSVRGQISSGATGRDDQYEYYDAIYAGQVEDLRLSCNRHETSKLLEDSIRKAVRGEMRGKGKVPFMALVSGDWVDDRQHAQNSTGIYVYATQLVTGRFSGNAVGRRMIVKNVTEGWTVHGIIEAQSSTSVFIPIEGIVVVEGSYPSSGDGLGDEVVVFFEDDTVISTTEFDSLPWVDIIGDPERIAATFPDGVVGQWIPQDVAATTEYNLSVKALTTSAVNTRTTDDGGTWTSSTVTLNAVTNTYTWTTTSNHVGLIQYETLSDFTEAADNTKVVGQVGGVEVSNHYEVTRGNRLMPSLIGEIAKDDRGNSLRYPLTQYGISTQSGSEGELYNWNAQAPKHSPVDLDAPDNNSSAVKALYTLTEQEGLLYLQFHGSELMYDRPASSTPVDGSAVFSFVKGERYNVTAGRHAGLYVFCVADTTITLDNYYVDATGKFRASNGNAVSGVELWEGSGWGDNSEIPVVDGDSTQTDLNGNTVKTFCHHTMIPVGIASNK